MYRKTNATHDVAGDTPVRFDFTDRQGKATTWVPDRIEEELRETDHPIGTHAPYWEYTVKVSGAVLKKDGTPGLNRRSRIYVDPKPMYYGADKMGLDDMPTELSALLHGKDGLSEWKRPSE